MIETQRYDDGSFYFGEVNEQGQRHGKGKITWDHNFWFDGKWSYGQPVCGTLVDNDFKYEGQVSYDNGLVVIGNGTSYYPNGDIYVGYHNRLTPSCKGVYYYSNGNIDKGFFVDGQLSSGRRILADGSIYKGYFYSNQKPFKLDGILKKSDGSSYKGIFINYELEGQGVYYFHKKMIEYQGEWKNGKKHGFGTLYYRNGDIYEGEWQNNLMHGKGSVKFIGGSLKGCWTNGKMEGKFTYTNYFKNVVSTDIYSDDKLVENVKEVAYDKNRKNEEIHFKDGSLYIGEVKNNKPNGVGILYPNAQDKSIYYLGNFTNGKLNGEGICELTDYRYTGNFKNGKITGQGAMYHKDREGETLGFFKNGIPKGYIRLSNQIANITIIEGVYTGRKFKKNAHITYNDNSEYYGMVNGFLPHGNGVMFYPDGTIIIGQFKKKLPHGKVIVLKNNKKYDAEYKNGKCKCEVEWSPKKRFY